MVSYSARNHPNFVEVMQKQQALKFMASGIQLIALLEYNRSSRWILNKLFPDAHDSYVKAKADIIEQNGILRYWGSLDLDNQKRLVAVALDEYGDQVEGD